MWANLVVVRLAGFSEHTLRLLPLALGVAALFLMRRLCRELLPETAALLAFAIFAVSYYPVRFATEAKPYSTDLFFSVALTLLAVAIWREPASHRRLAALALAAPIAVAASYPSVFILGGVGLTLLARVWRTGDRRARALWLTFAALALVTFFWLYVSVSRAQYEQLVGLAANIDFWNSGFPPLRNPLHLAGWFLATHTGRTFGYPVGAENGGSLLTFACFAGGVVYLHRRGRRGLLAMLLLPFALMIVAATLRLYPYGGSGRITQHLVPAICLLTGLGLAWFLSTRRPATRRRSLLAVIGLLIAWSAFGFYRFTSRRYQDERGSVISREFARGFWVEKARDAELVCAVVDAPGGPRFRGGLPSLPRYFANQHIYSGRHREGRLPRWERISVDHPLRVAVPVVLPPARTLHWISEPLQATIAESDAAVASWLEALRADYRQVGKERFLAEPYSEREIWVDLYEMVPEPTR
jgi:4-amino-4-deoxy-L-arabinose transferase-like glycosyltransferase